MAGIGYSAPRPLTPLGFAVDLSTSTVSGATTVTAAAVLAKFFNKTRVRKMRLKCTTIPHANVAVATVIAMNGTTTVASGDAAGAAANGFVDLTPSTTEANTFMPVDGTMTIKVVATASASGLSLGDYDIWAELE